MLKTRLIGWLLSAAPVFAVTLGDSRDAVIAELGEPESHMASGRREFLNYADGRVMLIDGKVREWRGKLTRSDAAAPTAAREATTTAAPAPPAPAMSDPAPAIAPRRTALWHMSLEQAQAVAKEKNKLILAFFTGSDWCPPCQTFEAEVAHDAQFAGIFSGSFVFFKNDWLRNTPQSPAVAAEVRRVRLRYGIARYPTLKILNAEGKVLDTVNWTGVEGGGTFKEIMIEAIDNSRKATKGGVKVERSWWPF
ncbi:MAG: hypothetical protein RIS54_1126 [Verrucomicrobiota bacterium]